KSFSVPVFGVVLRDNSIILRLESAIPVTTFNDAATSDIQVIYTPGTANNLLNNNGTAIAGFSKKVANLSPQTFTYNYNPVSGTRNNYHVSQQLITIQFNSPLNVTASVDPTLFTVTNNSSGASVGISEVFVTPKSVVINLQEAVGSDYLITYNGTGSNQPLKTIQKNIDGQIIVIDPFTIDSSSPPTTVGQVNRTFSNVSASNSPVDTNSLL
ncbi:hypothetical protein IQ225_16285, partial [Synechocystis salina LEGE 06155]|nr:hypothetical protein [Synechocystis salina LEGE 06155]